MVRVTNGIERDGERWKEIEGQRMMAHSAGGRSWKELERTGIRVPQPGVVEPAGNAEGSRGAGSNGLLQQVMENDHGSLATAQPQPHSVRPFSLRPKFSNATDPC